MSYCSDRGYAEGDLFEVISISKGMEEYLTKGIILKLVLDDNSTQPKFEYISGATTAYVYSGEYVWVSLDDLKKINTVKVQPADRVEQPEQVETYTKQDIENAFNHLGWTDFNKNQLLQALKQVSDSEYKEYIRLKQKFETEE